MDKAAANRILKSATAKLQKQFGNEVFVDTVNVKDIDTISTGSMMIDKASGIGGIGLGKIVEIYGENSSGKCLTKDTLISTPKGLETIEEIFTRNGVSLSEEITTTEVKTLLYNEHYELASTTHFSTNGKKPIIKVTTKLGTTIKGSYNHPLKVKDNTGKVDWKKLEDLSFTDSLVLAIPNLPEPCDYTLTKSDTLEIDHQVNNFPEVRLKALKNITTKTLEHKRYFISKYIAILGITYPKLRKISVRSSSIKELSLIKQILQNDFGVLAVLEESPGLSSLTVKESEYLLYQLRLSNRSYQANNNNIPVKNKSLWSKVLNLLKITEKDLDLKMSKEFYTHYDRITSIEFLEPELTFDFTMEGSPTFIANGVISHNTSLVSSTIAQAQKQYPDKKVLFLDAEQAYDLQYAQSFGVDIDPENFIFAQPGSIEESFEIMLTMAETGLFSLIVLDSVGASATLDQLRKGMDETTMGSLAKKMSEGIHKLTPIANKTQTAIVMVNQTYSKMSTYASNAKETKGGSALKFAASMRIELKKRDLVASEGDKDTIIGQAIEYIFRKNKLGQPYLSGETFLYFGKGFDRNREIIDIALSNGYIIRGGAWYNFTSATGEEMKFMGKDRLLEFLINSPDDLAMFEKIVLDSLNKNTDELPLISKITDEDS